MAEYLQGKIHLDTMIIVAIIVGNYGGVRMDLRTETMLERDEWTLPLIEGYDDELADYLTQLWQDGMNQLSDTLDNATLVLLLFKEDSYRVTMTCDRHENPFNVGDELRSTGSDFIDLVKAYKRMLLIEDASEDSRLDESAELAMGYENMIGVPIRNREGLMIGELIVLRAAVSNIDSSDVNLLTWMAASIEESIKTQELKMIMKQIGIHDHLTHLITRERMMTMIQAEFDRSQRSEMPFSIVVIDIDNFKGINESVGFEAGDRVLQEFSSLIMERIRHIDYACRWDGNAFAILLPQTEMIGANQLVTDLFFSLTHHIFPDVGRCYFSMGIADFSITDQNIEDMLVRLDKALYRVKAFGGNSHIARYHR